MKQLFLLLSGAVLSNAQSLSFGALAGAPISEGNGPFYSLFGGLTPGRWAGGPKVELHLPRRFSIELDALYRTSRDHTIYSFYTGPDTGPYLGQYARNTKTWDFPLLVKYRVTDRPIRPFLDAGIQFSRLSNRVLNSFNCLSTPPGACANTVPGPASGRYDYVLHRAGLVTGGGIEFKTAHMMIAPEVRVGRVDRGTQVTGLVGFTFGRRR